MSACRSSSERTPSRTSRLSSARKTLIVVGPSSAGTIKLSHVTRRVRQGAGMRPAGGANHPPRCRVVPCRTGLAGAHDRAMKHEAAAVALTWIPSEAIGGLLRGPFDAGITHYDQPPPERLDPIVET